MQLSQNKIDFLTKFWKNFKERSFIIDVMTLVGNRPSFGVYKSELPTEKRLSVTIDINSSPTDAKYAPPYSETEMRKAGYDDGLIAALMKDPVHGWRAGTGIELVHKEPDVWEQIRVWRNWNLMSDEMKDRSETKAIELFGVSNKEMFDKCMSIWNPSSFTGSVIRLECEDSKQTCVVGITDISEDKISYTYLGSGEDRLCGETDTFKLKKGVLKCCKEDTDTTVGRFLLNVLLLELPFDGAFNYINKAGFDMKNLEKQISESLMENKIDVPQYKKYVDNMYFIGHFCELCVPTVTRAALTTSSSIKDLKKELLDKYKGRLDDPKVIAEIENTLIAADKEYLKNDNSMRFYGPLGGKPFNIARKKLYLTVGGIETFSKDTGKYTFVEHSLSEGWTNDSIPAIANEIRKGSFNRGHETQLGGALTKYIMRVFQDLCIIEDDCHARTGLEVDFSKYPIENFKGRYINDKGTWVAITSENMGKYTNGKYVMRSPMYCKTEKGLCRKCAGDVYAKLNTKHVAMYIVDISSTFTTMALKLMHGSKVSIIGIGDVNQYIIQ